MDEEPDLEASRQKRQARFNELARQCVERGYKPNWVRIRYQNMFGHWPTLQHGIRTSRSFRKYEELHNKKLELAARFEQDSKSDKDKMKEEEKSNEIKLRDAITKRYLEIGKASNAGDIAKVIGVSETTIYKWLRDCGSQRGQGPVGCTMHYRERSGPRSKDTYSPAPSYLREIILELKRPPDEEVKDKEETSSEIELSDGGCLEAPDSDGRIRRRDVNGNCEEIREIGEENWYDWAELFDVTEADFLVDEDD